MSADDLRELHRRLDAEVRERWQRSLPFDELLSDRWERARELGFGAGASIYAASYVYGDVRVGADTWIGPFTVLDGTGGLEIGSTCSISAGVHVYTHDTVQWALTGGAAEYERAAVRIGDACHVGANAVIAPGVTIGDHSVLNRHPHDPICFAFPHEPGLLVRANRALVRREDVQIDAVQLELLERVSNEETDRFRPVAATPRVALPDPDLQLSRSRAAVDVVQLARADQPSVRHLTDSKDLDVVAATDRSEPPRVLALGDGAEGRAQLDELAVVDPGEEGRRVLVAQRCQHYVFPVQHRSAA